MTAIFLSHSSADNDAAEKMKVWLEEQGHTSLFLDFDPEAGIRAGGDWEQTLYHKLRQCQAVIALLTPNWLASKWCFAELVQAREKGKAIFPVKVQPCEAGDVFGDIQHIDLTEEAEEGYQRLALGLKERGLDPRDVYDWDPERPPYPGLRAFQEADAAIFFGRGEEILKGLEALDALRRRGRDAPRLALFLGASGSGKSSLVRAGLIPRLKKTPCEWLPVAPFRPQDDPLVEAALALAHEFKALGQPRDWSEIRKTLQSAAEQEPADGRALLMLTRELCEAAGEREATVVLTIDQAEELFGYSTPEAAIRFLRLLRAALEASDRQLMAMATLRSDFLGEFQIHRVLHDPAYDHEFAYQAVPVDPMPERNFAEIIRGPAALAGFRLEDGLVEAMVRDTGTRDALPLLAFTLRRLYERYAQDGLLELREYDQLGRLEGAIRFEAEQVLADTVPSTEDLTALRAAFVPTMVRINAEGGYARRRAYADEMPPRAKALLTRFVDARLLVSDRDKDGRETLEVSHEALLRTWPQLTAWLADDQDKLRLLESLHRAAVDWDNGGLRDDLLVHREGRLEDAEALMTSRRFAVPEDTLEKRYLDACVEAQRAREAAEREEQERRVRDAERLAAARKSTLQWVGTVAAIAIGFALVAGWQFWVATENAEEAERQSFIAKTNEELAKTRELEATKNESKALTALSNVAYQDGNHTDAVKLALAAWPRDGNDLRPMLRDTIQALSTAVQRRQKVTGPLRHEKVVSGAIYLPELNRILTWSEDGTARLWDGQSEKALVIMRHDKAVRGATYLPKLKRILTWSSDGTARLWDGRSEKALVVMSHDKSILGVRGATYLPEVNRILTWSDDRTARLWDGRSEIPLVVMRHEKSKSIGGVTGATYLPEVNRILTWSDDGTARLWDGQSQSETALVVMRHERRVKGATYLPKLKRILTWSGDGTARLWDGRSEKALVVMRHEKSKSIGGVTGATYMPEVNRILTWSDDGTARLWDGQSQSETALVVMRHERRVKGATYLPKLKRILTWSGDGTARLWDGRSEKALVVMRHERRVKGATYLPEGNRILTWSDDGTARLWDGQSQSEKALVVMRHDISTWGVTGASYLLEVNRILTWSGDGTVRLWDGRSETALVVMRHDKGFQGATYLPEVNRILTWSADGTVRLWDSRSEKALVVMRHDISALGVSGASYLPEVNRILTWSAGGTAWLWDGRSETPLVVMRHDKGIWGATYLPELKCILTWSGDGTARLWDGRSEKALVVMRHEKSFLGVRSATYLPEVDRILTWSDDGTARLWDGRSEKALVVMRHDKRVKGARYLPEVNRILTWSDDGTARLWDGLTETALVVMRHEKSVLGAIYVPEANRILTWSGDGTARLWDGESETALVVMRHDESTLAGTGATYLPEANRILTWSGDGTARLWDGRSEKALVVMRHDKRVKGARYLHEVNRILTWSDDGTTRLWDGRSETPLVVMRHDKRVKGARYLHEVNRILTWSDDGTTRLWDGRSETPLVVMHHNISAWGVTGASYLPEVNRILTWSDDFTARLWDGRSETPLVVMRHEKGVRGASYLPKLKRILTWSDDGTARLWDLSWLPEGHFLEVACRRWIDYDVSSLSAKYGIRTDPICVGEIPAPDPSRME